MLVSTHLVTDFTRNLRARPTVDFGEIRDDGTLADSVEEPADWPAVFIGAGGLAIEFLEEPPGEEFSNMEEAKCPEALFAKSVLQMKHNSSLGA